MATHPMDNPVDRGAWRPAVRGVVESDMPEHAHVYMWLIHLLYWRKECNL